MHDEASQATMTRPKALEALVTGLSSQVDAALPAQPARALQLARASGCEQRRARNSVSRGEQGTQEASKLGRQPDKPLLHHKLRAPRRIPAWKMSWSSVGAASMLSCFTAAATNCGVIPAQGRPGTGWEQRPL